MDIGYHLRRFSCLLENQVCRLRSFSPFLLRTKCWQSFLPENLMMVRSDFDSRWHAFILSSPMSKPILLKTLHVVCFQSFDSTVFGMQITSTHSRREYWATAQHCLSVFSSCFRRLLFTVFTIWTSDSSLLTHFRPVFPFYTPWKRQKTSGFLTFSGSIEREHWPEMG